MKWSALQQTNTLAYIHTQARRQWRQMNKVINITLIRVHTLQKGSCDIQNDRLKVRSKCSRKRRERERELNSIHERLVVVCTRMAIKFCDRRFSFHFLKIRRSLHSNSRAAAVTAAAATAKTIDFAFGGGGWRQCRTANSAQLFRDCFCAFVLKNSQRAYMLRTLT